MRARLTAWSVEPSLGREGNRAVGAVGVVGAVLELRRCCRAVGVDAGVNRGAGGRNAIGGGGHHRWRRWRRCGIKHIGRAGVGGTVVRPVAVHAGGAAVLRIRPDHNGVARNRHRIAELVTAVGVGGFEIGLLAPGRAAAHKHIGRAGVGALLSARLPSTPVALLSSRGAPTTRVSPETATEMPNRSLPPVLEALR